MEIGISMFGDLHFNEKTQTFQDPGQRLNEILEEIKLADEVGLDVFGIGEHHRADYAVSSPEMLLMAAAGITKNIKLTSAVTVLSSSDPVKVYQNFAMLDQVSKGRAEITVGRGSFIESFPLFGYDLNNYDKLFSEKLDLFLNLNNAKGQTPVNWRGSVRAPLINQTVYPKQERSIDTWIAVGGTPESVVRAAKLGLPLIIAIIGGSPIHFKPLFELYKREYIAAGHDIAKMQLATHSHGLIANDGQALSDAYFPVYAAQAYRVGKDRGWSRMTKSQFEAGRSREGAYFIGETNEVIDKILYHQESFGLTRFLMHSDMGAPDHVTQMKSIELLGTVVAPAVRKALGR